MRRVAVILSVILALTVCGTAQVNRTANAKAGRTVTNTDLDRFKQKRLAGEKEYQEHYAELGFPSPDELDRQIEQSRVVHEELSAKLRQERLERERLDLDRAKAEAEIAAAYAAAQPETYNSGYSPYYGYGGYGYGGYGYGSYYSGFDGRFGNRPFFGGRFNRFGDRRTLQPFYSVPGYYATPAGVFPTQIATPRISGGRGGRRR